MRRFRWAVLSCAAVLLLHAACGGGGGSSAPAAPPPSAGAFEGPWTGSFSSNAGGTVTATALVLGNGEVRYVATNGIQAVGNTSASSSSLTAAGTMYAPTGYTFPVNGAKTAPFTLTASGTGGASLSGTYAGAGDTGTFTFNYFSSANYDSPVSLADMAGAYTAANTTTGIPISGRLTSGGALTGWDGLGLISGTLTPVTAGKNAFRVYFGYTLYASPGIIYYTGLAFFDFSLPAPRIFLQTTGPGGQQIAGEFHRTGP